MRKKIQKNNLLINGENGITILTLVITIIIIIILASITLSYIFGDDSIIKKAELAKEMTHNSTTSETEQLNKAVEYYDKILGTNIVDKTTETDPTTGELVTNINISPSNLELQVGETSTLVATVLPENATNPQLSWNSENDNVATVNDSGLITAIMPGSTLITANSTDGSNISASCNVTVEPKTIFELTVNEGTDKDTIIVTVENGKGIESIELVTQEEKVEYNTDTTNVVEEFDVYENGEYTVRVTYGDGSTEEKSITISNFAFEPVARIGATEYETLREAVDAAPINTQTTIELLRDFDQSVAVYIPENKNIIIDMQGKTITLTTGYLANLGILDIKSSIDANGKIVSNHTEKVCVANYGTMSMTSGTLNSINTNAIRNNQGTVNVYGGTIQSSGQKSPAIISYDGTKVNINGGTISSANTDAVHNYENVTLTMSNGTVQSTLGNGIFNGGNSTTTITGGQVISYAKGKTAVWNETGTTTISNSQITGVNSNGVYNENGTVYINSGTFNATTDDLTNGLAIPVINAGATSKTYINGGTLTSNLVSAFNQGNGELIIDGATITSTSVERPVLVNQAQGTLTIKSGSISSSETNAVYNETTGNIVIQGGEITGSGVDSPTLMSYGGNVSLEGGNIKAVNTGTSAIASLGNVNVSAGTIDASYSIGIQTMGSGNATITNGTITSANGMAIVHNSSGILTIQGGNITQTGSANPTIYIASSGDTVVSNAIISSEQGMGIATAPDTATGTVTVNSGNISTGSVDYAAILNQSSSNIIVLGGTVTCNGCAIYNVGTGYVRLGTDDGNVSYSSPEIVSPNTYYTVYSATLYFYDGILRGGGISSTITTNLILPSGKSTTMNTSGLVYYTTLN